MATAAPDAKSHSLLRLSEEATVPAIAHSEAKNAGSTIPCANSAPSRATRPVGRAGCLAVSNLGIEAAAVHLPGIRTSRQDRYGPLDRPLRSRKVILPAVLGCG